MVRKVTQARETITQDANGKIIKESTMRTFTVESEPEYVKLYVKHVLFLKDMSAGLNAILMVLLSLASYGNLVVINRGVKKAIAQATGLKEPTINKALIDLTKGEILFRQDRGIYLLNPYIFGKGSWRDNQRLRIEADYTEEEGQTWKTVIEKKRTAIEKAKDIDAAHYNLFEDYDKEDHDLQPNR